MTTNNPFNKFKSNRQLAESKQSKSEPQSQSEKKIDIDSLTPFSIIEHLDKYVIGQESAKKSLAVSIYSHFKFILNEKASDLQKKSNILVVGPSGSGKTLIVETIANLLDVPFANCDVTTLTQSGYIGDDVESVISRLFINSNNDVSRTERGIVFLDEFDKICEKNAGSLRTLDVNGKGVQQSLLKMMEGSNVTFKATNPENNHTYSQTINTKNILFICAGAFVGIDEIVNNRVNKLVSRPSKSKQSIGFGGNGSSETEDKPASFNEELKLIQPEDIINYGFLPEIVGRMPTIVQLNKQTLLDYERIVCQLETGVLQELKERLQEFGLELVLSSQLVKYIVNKLKTSETGARAVRGIFTKILERAFLELPTIYDKLDANYLIMTADLSPSESAFLKDYDSEREKLINQELEIDRESTGEQKEDIKIGFNQKDSKGAKEEADSVSDTYGEIKFKLNDKEHTKRFHVPFVYAKVKESDLTKFPNENSKLIKDLIEVRRKELCDEYVRETLKKISSAPIYELDTSSVAIEVKTKRKKSSK